jgi:hypothetical protein
MNMPGMDGFVSAHDFSRAVKRLHKDWASAPAICEKRRANGENLTTDNRQLTTGN